MPGRGPRPFRQRRASTIFLRVPDAEWPAVSRGYKREFRSGSFPSQLFGIGTPTPVVAYRIHNGRHDAKLMLLEEAWQEPLGAISPESLAAEGHDSLASFRKAWMARERKRFRPTKQVFVYRLRPIILADAQAAGEDLFALLYGEFYDPEQGALRLVADP